jgi:AAA domain
MSQVALKVVPLRPPEEAAHAKVSAMPFVFTAPSRIPRRESIYGKHYNRKHLSETVAMPGVGKSSLSLAESLAITTGRPLLGIKPDEQCNVWVWNGEDPLEELQRRVVAAAVYYDIDPSELEGRLFVNSGRDSKIVIAIQSRTGASVDHATVEAIINTIRANKIGLMIVDPFIASHRVAENDNPSMELVASTWAHIAEVTGCAIELVHHARKTGGADVTTEDGRGGGAILAKVRSARTLNGMSRSEADKAGVKNHRQFFKVQNGKSNLSPSTDAADWYQLKSVDLGNGPPSDSVGVVTPWKLPNLMASVTADDLSKAQAAVVAGKWRENSQAKEWAGIPIAKALGLDVSDRSDKAKVQHMLKAWSKAGYFVVVEGQTDKREVRSFIEVGNAAPSDFAQPEIPS